MADDVIRAFVAIELPEDVKGALEAIMRQLRDRLTNPDIKWVAPQSLHLTLKFLGQVPTARIEDVQGRLANMCAMASPMQFEVKALGAFPSTGSPRVIWVGLGGDIARLTSLAGHIDATLSELGFQRETRPFTPHLTIARIRQGITGRTRAAIRTALSETEVTEGIRFQATTLTLMRSQLLPGGAVYSRLALVSFGW